MALNEFPSPTVLSNLFSEEVGMAGGFVSDTFRDAARLFLRSVLPGVREVRPGDNLQAGVALRATAGEVWVHPYVFRQICRNGAIIAHALQTRHIDSADCATSDEAA